MSKRIKNNKMYSNKSIIFKSIALILVFLSNNLSAFNTLDSLRLEKKDGQNFIIHKVDKGQTLFGTLRKYGTSLSQFKTANPEADVDIKIGQILRIPYFKTIKEVAAKQKLDEKAVSKSKPIKGEQVTFIVEDGMTLFKIAKLNKVTVADLKRMNNLESDIIEIGQELIVKEGTVSKEKLAEREAKKAAQNANKVVSEKEIIVVQNEKPIEVAKAEPIKKEENTVKKEDTIAKTIPKKVITIEQPKPKIDTTKPKIEIKNEPVEPVAKLDTDGEREIKTEIGIAELIAVESKSGKYLALHKSAPMGTLVQVKNETNGASVWVKVIGRLPEVDQNENIIIKLSPKAMDRVSPVDKRFRAKINYTL